MASSLTIAQKRRMLREFDAIVGKHNHTYSKSQFFEAVDEMDNQRGLDEATLHTDVDTATTGRTWTLARFRKINEAYMRVVGKDGV